METYDLIWAATDTLPEFTATLYNGDGQPIDLRNATVTFVLETLKGTPVGVYPVSIVDDVGGVINFKWADTATDDLFGRYRGRIAILWIDDDSLHVPNDTWLRVWVT